MTAKRPVNRAAKTNTPQPLLRRADQAVVATLILLALVGMAVYWFILGGPRGELIEIDRAKPLTARYLVDINQAPWPDQSRLELLANFVFRASELPNPPHDSRATPGIDAAERLLTQWLADGPRHSRQIFTDGRSAGLSPMSFYRAKRRVGAIHRGGFWSLA